MEALPARRGRVGLRRRGLSRGRLWSRAGIHGARMMVVMLARPRLPAMVRRALGLRLRLRLRLGVEPRLLLIGGWR